MKKEFLSLLIVFLLLYATFSGCMKKEVNPAYVGLHQQLLGKWYNPMANHFYVVFYDNGTGDSSYNNQHSPFTWTALDEQNITWYNYMGSGINCTFRCDFIESPSGTKGDGPVTYLLLNATEGGNYSGMLFTRTDLRAPTPMAGLPWVCQSTGEVFEFGYMDSVGQTRLTIRNKSSTQQFKYEYHNGYLIVNNIDMNNQNVWTTYLLVDDVNETTMTLTWHNSSDDVIRWNDLTLVRATENTQLSEQYTNLVRYVVGHDGLYAIPGPAGANYKVFEFYGYANIWSDYGVDEWTENVPAFTIIDDHGVIMTDVTFGAVDLPPFTCSQSGANLTMSYLENTLHQQLPQHAELFVYGNEYYGQRIYYKDDTNQTYPYLIGLGRDFNMTRICWLPGYNFAWLWTTECQAVGEPGPGITIDTSDIPTTVQRNVPFDFYLRFYTAEGGMPADPSDFFVRIDGSPCQDFVRYATGVYYVYNCTLATSGAVSVNISAYRGSLTNMVHDEKNVEIVVH